MSTDFEWPTQYFFPPFFTIQPNQETRKLQLEIWSNLILKYCKHNKMFILDKSGNSIPLFNNSDISRQLSIPAVEIVLKDMAQKGLIEWTDAKEERCYVLWHSLAEWGDMIYSYANANGLGHSVATYFELVNPDEETEFKNMDYAMLTKILSALQAREKAELIDPDGVKFFWII